MSTMGYVTTLKGAEDSAILDLNFETNRYKMNGVDTPFSDLFTFSRSTQAGVWNDKGVYDVSPANSPRFDYDPITKVLKGLLVEETRTNLFPSYNRAASMNKNLNAVVVQNFQVAPDGTLTGDLLSVNATGDGLYRAGFTSSGPLIWSAHVKKVTGDSIVQLTLSGAAYANVAGALFNLTTGTVTPDATITAGMKDVGNGWYRLWVSRPVTNTGTPTHTVGLYSGSAGTGKTFAVWGMQAEAGAGVSSLIITPTQITARASTATYFDSLGVLQVAVSGVPRYNAFGHLSGKLYPIGVLTEAAATNITFPSNGAGMLAGTTRTTFTDTGVKFIDGVSAFMKLAEDTTASQSHFAVPPQVTIAPNTTYTMSYYIKPAERTSVSFQAINGAAVWAGGAPKTNIDFNTLTTTQENCLTRIINLGGGVYRICVTATSGATGGGSGLYPVLLDATGAQTYTGDGVSGMFFGGYQVEVGMVATSYIITTTAQATRAADSVATPTATRTADNCSIRDLKPWYNTAASTFATEMTPQWIGTGGTNAAFYFRNAANAGFSVISLRRVSLTTALGTTTNPTGGTEVDLTQSIGDATRIKMAFALALNNAAFSAMGRAPIQDSAVVLPTPEWLAIGQTGSDSQVVNGHIHNFRYFPTRLSNEQVQILSN